MKVSVIGVGNVGVAIATDLSIKGHDVSLIKSSQVKSEVFERLLKNGNKVFLKENGVYKKTTIPNIIDDISKIVDSEVIFITIQSIYHEDLIMRIKPYLNKNHIIVCICSYMSSFFFKKHYDEIPIIVETTGPYLEGRTELNDKIDEVVFRVGCRLTRSPLSVSDSERTDVCMDKILQLYNGFSNEYSIMESALLNPNMVIHTVGSIMSIPRIEFSHGNFCMYREAYARGNDATINILLQLDKEKQKVLEILGCKPIDIFDAGGFFGDKMESFYSYSESSDRAISPTSVKSRYIMEDVSQGLVLFESIAKYLGIAVPIATSLIDISGVALNTDFRENGRTIQKLCASHYIDRLVNKEDSHEI
ncbi:MAG: NAD/NADP octopine/nopaline dehydrogenase family protein [Clostridiales bacterium]|nr:NAD/NADP octopine/nopaline dehydrogenase family protein [Clostridiales bacterium]MCM1576985.1 NAD/NADP octopine/nopaline dehydrogenase family protein [Bacteroides sp.]